MHRQLRILVADDNLPFCTELHDWLDRHADLRIAGMVHNGRDAVTEALRLRPDVVLMDVAMPVLNGIEATRRIVAADDDIRVIAMSLHADEQLRVHALHAGAKAWVLKENLVQGLLDTLHELAADTPDPAG